MDKMQTFFHIYRCCSKYKVGGVILKHKNVTLEVFMNVDSNFMLFKKYIFIIIASMNSIANLIKVDTSGLEYKLNETSIKKCTT